MKKHIIFEMGKLRKYIMYSINFELEAVFGVYDFFSQNLHLYLKKKWWKLIKVFLEDIFKLTTNKSVKVHREGIYVWNYTTRKQQQFVNISLQIRKWPVAFRINNTIY